MPTFAPAISKAIGILKEGGVIIFPTDTVYGLGGNALDGEVVRRVYEIKKRPTGLAFPLLLADPSQIAMVARDVSSTAWHLVQRFLPGGLTLILPKSSSIPDIISGGGNTVGVRIPHHAVTLALIQGLGAPLIGTSANVSGRPSVQNCRDLDQEVKDKVDFIIDGGECSGMESTIIDVTVDPPHLIREGVVPRSDIQKICSVLL
jgi:L-threonylcarbamoyladenylate synthase